MTNAVYNIPPAYNEPVLNYAHGSPEKVALKAALAEARTILDQNLI